MDEHGVHVNPNKIYSINEWPTSTTLPKLCNFLGLSTFYHKIVLGLSHIALLLIQVTKGGEKSIFFWDE